MEQYIKLCSEQFKRTVRATNYLYASHHVSLLNNVKLSQPEEKSFKNRDIIKQVIKDILVHDNAIPSSFSKQHHMEHFQSGDSCWLKFTSN